MLILLQRKSEPLDFNISWQVKRQNEAEFMLGLVQAEYRVRGTVLLANK
jgi:hypothetical protein